MNRRTFFTGSASLALGATAGCLDSLQESHSPWNINICDLYNWTTEEQILHILVQSDENIILWESHRVQGRTPDSGVPESANEGLTPDKQVDPGDVKVRLRVGERQDTHEIPIDDVSGKSVDLLFHYGKAQAYSSDDTVAEPYITYAER